ncbi:hypothetical protein C7S13_5950 [Burkholderia cepacia]|nr:hypothetical protein [Burkholderia cepacia]
MRIRAQAGSEHAIPIQRGQCVRIRGEGHGASPAWRFSRSTSAGRGCASCHIGFSCERDILKG